MSELLEVNLDSLVGIGHHFGGLSYGNLASERHKDEISKPREAALQSLEKAMQVKRLVGRQLILPPLLRPATNLLKQAGFDGPYEEAMRTALIIEPQLVSAIWSSSFVWTANLGFFTPSCDSYDRSPHLTLANLCTHLHRSLEAWERYISLEQWFGKDLKIHPALPSCLNLADEGAANHTRLFDLARPHLGIHHLVYGQPNPNTKDEGPKLYPARQSSRSWQWLIRNHKLDPNKVIMSRQLAQAIDAGVFHNDVICTGHGPFLLCHAQSFVDQDLQLEKLRECFKKTTGSDLQVYEVSQSQLTLDEAVQTYLFNSQILCLPEGLALIAAQECKQNPRALAVIEDLKRHWPLQFVQFIDLTQSMHNGGGPACLRLRVPMTQEEFEKLKPLHLTQTLYEKLHSWICKRYPQVLTYEMLVSATYRDYALQCHKEILEIFGLPTYH